MSPQPADVWGALPDAMQQSILADLTTVRCEVIEAYDRADLRAPSAPPSGDLQPAVDGGTRG